MREKSASVTKGSAGFGGILAFFLINLVFPGSTMAQSIEGTLTDGEDGSRIEGALVLLVSANGQELEGRLSDQMGEFRFPAPEPGLYRLRAVRIGYATLLSESFSVLAGETTEVRLVATKEAIPLRGIDVEGVQGCRIRPEEGLAVARVWEAVQKALTSQSWTEREGFFRYEVLLFNRDLDSRARPTGSEELSKTEVVDRVPMLSLPAETLVADGFVREIDYGVYEYMAPDAQVLLSNAFLNTHCLKLTEDKDLPSLIGLAFEPVEKNDTPDVEGTLWVDRNTGHLKYLEFGYTWVPFNRGRDEAGGRVEFEILPNGAWIVRRWRIRMPTIHRVDAYNFRLVGFKETGAEVTSVSPSKG